MVSIWFLFGVGEFSVTKCSPLLAAISSNRIGGRAFGYRVLLKCPQTFRPQSSNARSGCSFAEELSSVHRDVSLNHCCFGGKEEPSEIEGSGNLHFAVSPAPLSSRMCNGARTGSRVGCRAECH